MADRLAPRSMRIRKGINQEGRIRAGIQFQHYDTEENQLGQTHAGKTRNHKISVKFDNGIPLHSVYLHQEVTSINYGSQPSFRTLKTSACRYIIPARRHRGNTSSEKNVEKTRKHILLVKNDNGKLGHSTSSHLEGNVNHNLETSTVVQKENQLISREIFEGNMQEINHNLKKIKENQRLLKLNDNSIKFEISLKKFEVAVKLMACLAKSCAEFVHREK